MATYNTFKTHNNANGTTFDFPFPTLTVAGQPRTDIKVEVNGDLKTENTNGTNNDYSINGTDVVFNSTQTGVVHIYRDTNVASAEHVYATGSSIRAKDLNENQDQYLFSTQEAKDAPISGSKIVNNSIPTDAYKDLSITAPKIADNAVITRTINNLAVTTGKIADDAITSAKIADDAVGVDHIADNSITSNMIQNGAVNSVDIADNAVTNTKVADNAINTAELVNDAVTVGKIADNELKTLAGMQSATASQLASGTALTATTTNLNNLTGMSLAGSVTNEATKFPTSAAVKSYVDAQIASINAFEIIANEDSFPATQFDDGVVLSISNAGGLVINSSGVATNARTVGSSSDNVTINGFPSSLYGEALPDSVGLLLTSTGANQTYTYHKLLATETDVKQLSDDINDFFARYRVGTVAPSTALDAGDLFYNTTSKVFQVYNGTAWEEVKNTGNFFISTLSPAFNGTVQDFTITNAPSYAEQIILSINGVIQKPNSGTSTPSEGFALSGSTIKLAAAPVAGSTYHAVVMGEAVNIGFPSDNTVTTASLQNGAVSTDKLQTDAVTTAKIANVNVTTAKIADDAVTTAKLAAGAVGTTELDTGAITTAKLANDAVTNAKIGAGAVGSTELDTGAVTTAKLAADSVTNAKIGAGAVGTTELDTGAVTTAKLADDAVSADKIGTLTGNVDFNDNAYATFGNSNDLKIYHDGSHSYIANSTNNLYVNAPNFVQLGVSNGGEKYLTATENGAVELYYNNVKKFETTSDGIDITGTLKVNGSTISTGGLGNVVEDSTPQLGGDLQSNGKDIDFADNDKAVFGTGNDLQIYHDGTNGNSHINESGSGSLVIKATNTYINSSADEAMIAANADGSVDLYYDNAAKMSTSSFGVNIIGDARWGDNRKATFGNDGTDLQIYHDGTHSYIEEGQNGNLVIKTNDSATYGAVVLQAGEENSVVCLKNGSVELFHDNSKKLHTHSGGITISGSIHMDDNNKYIAGSSDDLQIYHDGSNSYINDSGTGDLIIKTNIFRVRGTNDEAILTGAENGNVSLYYDNSKKFGTDSGGAQVFGVLRFDDGSSSTNQINFGNSADLKIYHDGSDSRIEDTGTGGLYLSSNQFVVLNAAKNEYQIQGTENAGVQLYYNGSEHFKTSSVGVTVTGNIAVGDGNGIDFSATGNGSNTSNVAELLDDYEEGNWSPQLYGGSNQASGYSIQSGSYTKIGRLVHVNFAIAITGKGSMSGDLKVTNLPYGVSSNIAGTSIEHSGICAYWSNVDPNSSHITIAADSDDSLYLRHTVGAEDNPDQMQASDIDSDFTVRGSISYYYG